MPIQYKQIIENILCTNDDWTEKFSVLIDVDEYFANHFIWEQKLVTAIKHIMFDLNTTIEYDFEYDEFSISLTQDQISSIFLQYQDEELKKVMSEFASLLVDYIYTREYQEENYDYYALSVSKMHKIKNL